MRLGLIDRLGPVRDWVGGKAMRLGLIDCLGPVRDRVGTFVGLLVRYLVGAFRTLICDGVGGKAMRLGLLVRD